MATDEPASTGRNRRAPADRISRAENDETTPLLSHQNKTLPPAEQTQPGSNDEEQAIVVEEVKGFKLWLILCTSWIGVFLGAIDSTIIATLSAPISSEFKSLSLLSWLATAYLISNADENAMILGRVIAGIGGGGLMSISTFIGTDLVPLRKRGVIQGVGNICYGAGAMLGGLFGGVINDNSSLGWRLAFLVQVPPVLVSAALVAYLVRIPPKVSDKSFLARIDFTGAISLIVFLVLLLLGLNAGGNVVPWVHPLPLTTLPLSLVALVGFVIRESRARQPVIPVRLLLDRTVFAACMTNLLCSMVNMAILFYAPIYLQTRGSSATEAGLVILFGPVGISVCSIGSGLIMKRTGRYIALGIASVLLMLACVVLLTTLDEGSPKWLLMVGFLLLGSGQGAMLTVTLLACLAAVDHSQQAVITSATYAFRSVGGTVGITAASAIYQNVLKRQLWDRFGALPGAAEEIGRIRDDLGEIGHLPDGWTRDGVMASFMQAFRAVWFLMLALALLGLVCVSLMRQHKLHSTLARRESD
ncbi:hypothetical protein DL766_007773 [Monosporascus sp. MC13-8B]|uniref:Major facilitator superfamily (MFS) profile domain-containing protein n=1 Tax=Monosporascus cannonballus TaxID=155416 RepID=A0ABY0HED3_9PEZI|nr:hypothetical protein DL763_006167 [Monosporascus cannonballus]RYO91577.1 hypothetical protein DL762_002110 [Monosporascus cannonballus]RYP22073.1 hypothetical protein DL766_007773 [Monosporascus sp. MC13-8B]